MWNSKLELDRIWDRKAVKLWTSPNFSSILTINPMDFTTTSPSWNCKSVYSSTAKYGQFRCRRRGSKYRTEHLCEFEGNFKRFHWFWWFSQSLASGWGTLAWQGSSPERLQKVYVPAVSNEKCAEAYNNIRAHKICAGEEGKDTCQGEIRDRHWCKFSYFCFVSGDSGGP